MSCANRQAGSEAVLTRCRLMNSPTALELNMAEWRRLFLLRPQSQWRVMGLNPSLS